MTPENEQEIERLKAALKEAAKSLAEDEQEIERLEGDANSLCNTITSIQLSLKERDAEIERLRAGLQKIANESTSMPMDDWDDAWNAAARMAEAALEDE